MKKKTFGNFYNLLFSVWVYEISISIIILESKGIASFCDT